MTTISPWQQDLMTLADFLNDVFKLVTSSILCLLVTIVLVILFILILVIWKIVRIRSEMGWLHQPFGGSKRR